MCQLDIDFLLLDRCKDTRDETGADPTEEPALLGLRPRHGDVI